VKVQCELCRELVPLADFTPKPDGIEVRCPACGGTFFVPREERAPAPEPAAPPTPPTPAPAAAAPPAPDAAAPAATRSTCPKCGRAQAPAAACRYCGLVFAKWDPSAAGPAAGDDVARRLHAAVEEDWADEARHEKFIKYCAQAGCLPFAARCYRERLNRGEDPVARAQQERIISVAEATYLAPARASRDAPLKHRRLLVVLVVVMFGGMILYLTAPMWRGWFAPGRDGAAPAAAAR
jgi:hypothetical protein